MDVSKVVGVDVGRRFKVRVGRGSGSGLGKTSGRGSKGAASRTGFGGLLHREGGQMPLIRRLPKRGFNNKLFRVDFNVVNVDRLVEFAGETITLELLKAKGLLAKNAERLKVLGDGDLAVKLDVCAHAFSSSARAKIEAAGGTCTVVGREPAPVVRKRPKSPPRAAKV